MRNKMANGPVHMFKTLQVKNFKAYKDSTEVPLAPLTILVGANNSGKSSLIQALLVLAQTLEDPARRSVLVTTGSMVELNGFYDIIHRNGTTGRTFSISITAHPNAIDLLKSDYFFHEKGTVLAERFEVSFKLSSRTKEIVVDKTAFWAEGKRLIEVKADGSGTSDVFETSPEDQVDYHLRGFMPSMVWPTPDDKQREKTLRPFGVSVRACQELWRILLNGMFRAGPLRSRVPWYSGVGTTSSSELGLGGVNLIADLGNPESGRARREKLVDVVNSWLSGKYGMPNEVHVRPIDKSGNVRSLLGDEPEGAKDINVAAMGEGVSQILPIITRTFASEALECLFIEQPEIHLHPALQADLADLFIAVVLAGHRQVVLETHSEHLLLRIRRRVAEGVIDPNLVSILFVDREGSESTVKPLAMNGRGHFDDWPKGFFDEGYQEAMALARAASKKPREDEATDTGS